MTSSYPSSFTSPADATDQPNQAPGWRPLAVQSGVADGPRAEPRNRKAAPGSPGPYNGAPTTTSSYPSPFTSPAEAPDQPNQAPGWRPLAAHSGVADGPRAEPRNRKAAPPSSGP